MTTNKNKILPALRAAFPYTTPILAGFLFLGMAYGVYMHVLGFPLQYPIIMAAVIFGGSLEFVAATMLLAPFAPLTAFFVALMVQARHLFYGLALLSRYQRMGWKKPYLIFALCDETFSIAYSTRPPQNVDASWFYFFISLLNQIYWVAGAALGGLMGNAVFFDVRGLGFVMTAMFVVIFLENFLHTKQHGSAYIGFAASIFALYIFGADTFLLPAMGIILLLLTLCRHHLEKQEERT